MNNYMDKTHFYGRIWTILAVCSFLLGPIAICIYYDAWPGFMPVFKGLLGVAPVFWTIGIIEVFTYTPMLGAGGSYLAFVTGNITNLKAPCAITALKNAGVEASSEEGEVVSTIAIAVSSIVTTVIIAAGVLLLAQLAPIINSPILAPAFKQLLPSLFGGLAVVFIAKDWKVAITPMLFMLTLYIAVPALAGAASVLVPVGALIAIGASRLLYKRGFIK